jgi:long-chain acyl-CoA synthetase
MTESRVWPFRSMDETYALLTAPGGPFEMREEQVGGLGMRTYVRAAPTLRAIFDRGLSWGDRTYLAYQDEHVTFAAHYRATAHLARAFAARFGLVKGDRVALAMRNLPEWVVTFWATVASGAIIVPINAWGSGEEIAFAVRDSGAKLLVCDAERLQRVAPHLPDCGLSGVLAARTPKEQLGPALALESIIGETATYGALPDTIFPEVALEPDDGATIFYTSGTTGRPKGALGSHRAMATNIVNVGLRVARAALRRGDGLDGGDPGVQRVTLLPTPLFHVTGTHSGIAPAMLAGTKIVLMYKWDAGLALDLVDTEKVNTIVTVPTMSWQLLGQPRAKGRDLSSLDTLTFGGAPAPAELPRRIAAHFPGIFVASGFGMTETSSVVTSNSGEDLARRPDSVGTVMPCNDVRVVDGDGKEVAPGRPGELLVRGPNIIQAYWNRPEDSANAIVDGWLHTGDIVRIDDEGFVYILDRAKDMIIRGGENIYCVEVEDALARHPQIIEAAVFGLPDPRLGEIVGAAVRLAEEAGLTDADLAAFAGIHLAKFKIPARFFPVRDPIPRNIGGKILKRELKAQLGLA